MAFTEFPIPTKTLAEAGVISLGWLNVQSYGAVGDGTTDDTAAIQAAIDAADPGGTVYFPQPAVFYKCDSGIDLNSATNLKLVSVGADTEIKDDLSYSRIVYTGTADRFLDISRSRGLTLEGLDIRYNNASFAGDLVSSNYFLIGGQIGYNFTARRCIFAGISNTVVGGRAGIYMPGMVRATIQNCGFYWSDYGIIGYSAASGDSAYSTAVTVLTCWFNELNLGGIANPDQQWSVISNVFEPLDNGDAGGIKCGVLNGGAAEGLYIAGNGFWDATSNAGSWIDFKGNGLDASGNFATLANGSTFLQIISGATGIRLGGGTMLGGAGGIVFDANGATVSKYVYDGSMKIDGGITLEANMGGVTRGEQSFFTVVTPRLIGAGLAGSPIAGPGAGAGPSLSVQGTQLAGLIIVTTGTTPTADANVTAVAWGALWGAIPKTIILTPANANAAALSGASQVFVDRSQTTTDRFFIKAGASALSAAVTYEWFFQVVQ